MQCNNKYQTTSQEVGLRSPNPWVFLFPPRILQATGTEKKIDDCDFFGREKPTFAKKDARKLRKLSKVHRPYVVDTVTSLLRDASSTLLASLRSKPKSAVVQVVFSHTKK